MLVGCRDFAAASECLARLDGRSLVVSRGLARKDWHILEDGRGGQAEDLLEFVG